MLMKTLIFSLALVLLLQGCGRSDEPGAQPQLFDLNEAITLRTGDSGVLRGEDFSIRLLEVFDESRCPEGVMCLWAGEVKLKFAVEAGAITDTLVTAFPSEGSRAISGGYTLTITDVTPYPKEGKTIKPKDYRARLIISR